jgi:site-specific DNA recombinase
MRAVIYARYSSDNQREASIEDQLEVCRRYINRQGWTLVRGYEDRALSGASDQRPAYQQMLADAEVRRFDVVVSEALDRLGRRLSEVARLYDHLEFRGISLHAVNIGEVTTMHVGLLGTMAQLYLSDLKDKTRRGQLGRALVGKIPGGKAYGYRLVAGEPGERQIDKAEAIVVRRIFREFAAGMSPQAIAKALNAERIPGPNGRQWRDTTIRGQIDRGTGILNNSLYVGRIEWNRCSYVKDPKSGKRVARPNPKDLWEIVNVPKLRVVDDDLWKAVKLRQRKLSFEIQRDDSGNALNRAHRRKFLLSGLLKCGCCAGGFTIVAQDRYGCATHRSKGTCSNNATVSRQEIEARVLGGLKEKLLAPELVREFVRPFQEEVNRTNAEREQQFRADRQQLDSIKRKIAGIVTAIEEGDYSRALGDRLADLEKQQELLEARLTEAPPPSVRLHPRLAEVYAEKIQQLEKALNDPAIRAEAADVLRSLIDRIELRPGGEGQSIAATLHGALAQILTLCDDTGRKLPKAGASGSQLSPSPWAASRVGVGAVPGDPSECRKQAENCLRLARVAPMLSAHFEELAQRWLRVADDLERAEAYLAKLRAAKDQAG